MSLVIKAENVSKKYILRHQQNDNYHTLRDTLALSAKNAGKRLRSCLRTTKPRHTDIEDFWALNDISFAIQQGERIGIIGPNGAGKSTLLKILSRITELTTGRISIKGRIASLLEVGTGFHPELTGRENIYMNGAILGMNKSEIKQKFDAIVAFAEISKFLDTPVKRYSSGMYVRLAFAVAAHLEPDILIIDEVLAVGDAQFQKKCLGKMKEVGQAGRTVLFVSHNMQAVRQLCHRVLLLKDGKIIADEAPSSAIRRYLDFGLSKANTGSLKDTIASLPQDPAFQLTDITITQKGIPVGDLVESGTPLNIAIQYRIKKKCHGMRVYFDLCDSQGTILLRSFHDDNSDTKSIMEKGAYISETTIPPDILGPISYVLKIRATLFNVRCCVPPEGICIPFKVEHTGIINRAYLDDTFRAKLTMLLPWQTKVL